MNRKLSLIVLCVMFIVLAACGSGQDSMSYDSVYNSELGHVVTLGMSKNKIDELLGEGSKGYSYYEYDGLSIGYSDGKADKFQIDSLYSSWEVKGGISVGDKIDDVISVYGENEVSTTTISGFTFNLLQYYPNKKGESDISDNVATISFELDEDLETVESISVHK